MVNDVLLKLTTIRSGKYEMGYYAIAFFIIAFAFGIYAISGLTDDAVLMGTLLFSVFLILAVGCAIFNHGSRREKKK